MSQKRSLKPRPRSRVGPRPGGSLTIARAPGRPAGPGLETAHGVPRRPRRRWLALLFLFTQMLLDAGMVAAAYVIAYILRRNVDVRGPFIEPSPDDYLYMLAVLVACTIIVFNVSGLYRLQRAVSRFDEFGKICGAVSLGTVITIAVLSLALADQFIYSRQLLITGWILCILLVMAGRVLHAGIVSLLRRCGVDAERVLIVGAGETGQIILDTIERSPHLGYRVVGFVSDGEEAELKGVPVLGSTAQLADVVRLSHADEVIIALSGRSHQEILDLVYTCVDEPVSIKVYPDTFQLITNNELSIGDLDGLPLVSVRNVALRGFNRVLKRSFDIVFSSLVLVLLSPLMLLLALLVKLESPGPVFYAQERVGLDGLPFYALKFRSMVIGAEEQSGPVWAKQEDPRVTRLGRFMRRHSLDELPQFINVLFGEMSVVGPRPERPHFVEQFSQRIPRYMRRHIEKAGITGWAQVNGLRGDTSIEERTRYDLYYVENWSLLFDLKIIAKTALLVFRDRNAY
jgi:exopolysaccharide biosynthesis polyprenyl glycosylphosphotransferase